MARKTEQTETKTELTIAQRFTNAVVKSYGDVARGIDITPKQMKLISNYYIKLDNTFKNLDKPISWNQVNLNEFSLTLAHMAKLNLDMQLGHIYFIPFYNKNTGKYNMVPVISKEGQWYIAKTYGINPPESYVIELVYSNDKFSISKKDANHEFDSYTFDIENPFNRGEIMGGFGYLEYKDKTRNKLLVMTKQEILKYKTAKSSDNFWSGENAKKMFVKTIAKQLFKTVALDPDKINLIEDSFKRIETEELNFTATEAKETIEENMCSGKVIDIEFDDVPENVDKLVDNVENLNLLGEVIKDE